MMPPSEERELRPDASTPAGQPYSGLGPLTSEILLSSCPVDPWICSDGTGLWPQLQK